MAQTARCRRVKVAIIGAGLAGMATAWHLLYGARARQRALEVSIFDEKGLGEGTSAVPVGLLQRYGGARARLNWHAEKGWHATCRLLSAAEDALGHSIARQTELLRQALTPQQQRDFFSAAEQSAGEVCWYGPQECMARCPGATYACGIGIKQCILIDCKAYLTGLWHCCAAKGATFHTLQVGNLAELSRFDRIVVAAGAACCSLIDKWMHLSITAIKGQMIELLCPATSLSCPLGSQALILPTEEKGRLFVGSTYERDYSHQEPHLQRAEAELMPKAIALLPQLSQATVAGVWSGMRASMPNRRPLLKQITASCWLFTGLGSKGLLWHAFLAEELAQALIT